MGGHPLVPPCRRAPGTGRGFPGRNVHLASAAWDAAVAVWRTWTGWDRARCGDSAIITRSPTNRARRVARRAGTRRTVADGRATAAMTAGVVNPTSSSHPPRDVGTCSAQCQTDTHSSSEHLVPRRTSRWCTSCQGSSQTRRTSRANPNGCPRRNTTTFSRRWMPVSDGHRPARVATSRSRSSVSQPLLGSLVGGASVVGDDQIEASRHRHQGTVRHRE